VSFLLTYPNCYSKQSKCLGEWHYLCCLTQIMVFQLNIKA